MVVGLLLFAFTFTFAQVTENFNSRTSATTTGDIKPFLQDHCWFLQQMDINLNGNAPIEGDGSIVSQLGSGNQSGLYTAVLQVPGNMYVAFSYKFSASVTAGHNLQLALTDFNNDIYMVLETIDMSGKLAGTTYNYSNYFNNLPSGAYRLL